MPSDIQLVPVRPAEVDILLEMDNEPHARPYINATPRSVHLQALEQRGIHYLGIRLDNTLVGYIILVAETDHSVELRRILLSADSRGIGQHCMQLVEDYCVRALDARRIWLDVYEDNAIGRHIYDKLGYRQFREELVNQRRLLFCEKLPGDDRA